MSTTVNNSNPNQPPVIIEKTDSSGWVVAVVILILVIAAGVYAWMHFHRAEPAPEQKGASINVTIPTGGNNASGDTPSDNKGQ